MGSFTFETKSPPASTLIMKELKMKEGRKSQIKTKLEPLTWLSVKKLLKLK